MSFLTRSRMCPTEASTANWRPRNFFRVLLLAGLSTISRFLAIVGLSNAGRRRHYFWTELGRHRQQGGDSTTGAYPAARPDRGVGRRGMTGGVYIEDRDGGGRNYPSLIPLSVRAVKTFLSKSDSRSSERIFSTR